MVPYAPSTTPSRLTRHHPRQRIREVGEPGLEPRFGTQCPAVAHYNLRRDPGIAPSIQQGGPFRAKRRAEEASGCSRFGPVRLALRRSPATPPGYCPTPAEQPHQKTASALHLGLCPRTPGHVRRARCPTARHFARGGASLARGKFPPPRLGRPPVAPLIRPPLPPLAWRGVRAPGARNGYITDTWRAEMEKGLRPMNATLCFSWLPDQGSNLGPAD
jgi:hypothetical protein